MICIQVYPNNSNMKVEDSESDTALFILQSE